MALFLSHGLIDVLGKLPKNLYSSVIRNSLAPLVGIVVGAWLSYSLQESILSGDLMKFDPLSMGLFFAPLALVLNFLPVVIVLLVIVYVRLDEWFARLIKRSSDR